MKLHVIKRDGTLEEYSEEKIHRVVAAAGLSPQEARLLSSAITSWIKELSHTKFTPLKLRDKVIEELKKN